MRKIFVLIICSSFIYLKVQAQEKDNPQPFSIKFSTFPVAFIWTLTTRAEILYEVPLIESCSYGGSVALIYPSPFIRIHKKTKGFYLMQEFRKYNEKRNLFVGAGFHIGLMEKFHERYFVFPDGNYEKLIFERSNFLLINANIGFKFPLKSSRFYVEGYASPGIAFSNNDVSDLNQDEIDYLLHEEYWEEWNGSEFNKVSFSGNVGLNIGFNF